MRVTKILYYTSTILLTLLMLFSAYNYVAKHEMIADFFEHLNYPTYLVYPLAVAKILGLLAIWTRLSKWLTEWAYAGFFFDVVLAFFAHYMTDGGGVQLPLLGLLFVIVSYFTNKRLFTIH